MVTQGKNYRRASDPLAPGDRVIAMTNIRRRPGPRLNGRYNPHDRKRFVAHVVRIAGKRVTVRDHWGREHTFLREHISYQPTPRILLQRVEKVRLSRFDERLRNELGLPIFQWPEADPSYCMDEDCCDA